MIYTVRWTIDIVAASAVDAAQEARGIQLDPLALATAFEVTDANGETIMVDLGEGLGEELPAGAPSVLDKVKPGRFVLDAAREARDRTLEELAGTVRVGADAPEWPLDAEASEALLPPIEKLQGGIAVLDSDGCVAYQLPVQKGSITIRPVQGTSVKIDGYAVVPAALLNDLLRLVDAVFDGDEGDHLSLLADAAKLVREAST